MGIGLTTRSTIGCITDYITSDRELTLSLKIPRVGDSGSPVFTYINKKPVLLMTYRGAAGSGGGSGPFLPMYSDRIQDKINELAGEEVQLNYITQEDLNIYDNIINSVYELV